MSAAGNGLNERVPKVAVERSFACLEAPPCDICGAPACSAPWGADVCTGCGSVSASTLPSVEELRTFYAKFNVEYSGGGRQRGAADRQIRYARAYLALVRRFRQRGRLIDIGPSTNPFPNYAAEAGYQVTVVDYMRPVGLDPRIEFVQGTAEARPELSSRFDVVTAFAMIEHCSDPGEAAAALASCCVSGSIVLVMTPLVGDFFERNAPGRTRWFCPPEHLHLVSRAGMQRLFQTAGCNLVHCRRFELNGIRWAARYGLAAAEGVAGMALRRVVPGLWRGSRNKRFALGQQMALYVFRKT